MAFNLGQPRSVAKVLERELTLLQPATTLHFDCGLDYYEVLTALALGLLLREQALPMTPHALYQVSVCSVPLSDPNTGLAPC